MELADMQDLGSCAVRRVGSSPTFRTEIKQRKGESEIGILLFAIMIISSTLFVSGTV